jgi:hypothetical protein
LDIFKTETEVIKNLMEKEEETINSIVAVTGKIPLMTDILNEFSTTTLVNLEEITSMTKDLISISNTNQGNLTEWERN